MIIKRVIAYEKEEKEIVIHDIIECSSKTEKGVDRLINKWALDFLKRGFVVEIAVVKGGEK